MKKYVIKIVEYIFSLILITKKRNNSELNDKRIAFVELNGLGDVVTCNAVLNYFDSTKKDITLIVPSFAKKLYQDRFNIITCDIPWSRERNKYNIIDIIRTIIKLRKDIKKSNIDIFLDTRGDIRKVLLLRLAGAKKVISYNKMISGVDNYMEGRLLYDIVSYPNQELHRVDEHKYFINKVFNDENVMNFKNSYVFHIKNKIPLDEKIVLHMSGGVGNKVWEVEKWATIINYLSNKYNNNYFFVICTKSEIEYVNQLDLYINNTKIKIEKIVKDLFDLHTFLNNSKLYIGIDSGPLHIADSLGIKTIGLYGKSILKTWYPYNNGINSICHVQDKYKECTPSFKIQNTENINCIGRIEVKSVMNKIDNILKGEIIE